LEGISNIYSQFVGCGFLGDRLDPAATDFTVDVIGVPLRDGREFKTGIHFKAEDFNGKLYQLEVWLLRVRRAGIAAAYEEAFDTHRGIWRASITFLEFIGIDDRAEAITRIAPGIVLLSKIDQQGTFQEDSGYGGYTREQLIANNLETIERMAQQQKDTARIRPFTVEYFSQNYPIAMGRSTIYKYVKRHEWPDLERRYTDRCRELRSQS
jgi:hypothetical protein